MIIFSITINFFESAAHLLQLTGHGNFMCTFEFAYLSKPMVKTSWEKFLNAPSVYSYLLNKPI